MIFIVSSSAAETVLLTRLCEQRSWPCQACFSLSDFEKQVDKNNPRAVVVRQRLRDGYSDDILASLKRLNSPPRPHVIVLVAADCSIRQEARQVALGADCVLRDPVRMEVLLEYLAKYRTEIRGSPLRPNGLPLTYDFAGAQVVPHEHRLVRLNQAIHLAPQEIELLRLLSHSIGKVVPYPVLYSEIFNQRFAGDTANSRVLLAKVSTSFRRLGIDLRTFIEVIPKSGYLYSPAARKPHSRAHRSFRRVGRD